MTAGCDSAVELPVGAAESLKDRGSSADPKTTNLLGLGRTELRKHVTVGLDIGSSAVRAAEVTSDGGFWSR